MMERFIDVGLTVDFVEEVQEDEETMVAISGGKNVCTRLCKSALKISFVISAGERDAGIKRIILLLSLLTRHTPSRNGEYVLKSSTPAFQA